MALVGRCAHGSCGTFGNGRHSFDKTYRSLGRKAGPCLQGLFRATALPGILSPTLLILPQCLFQVGDQVFSIFQTHAQTDQGVGQAVL